MKSAAPLPKTPLPAIPDLDLKAHEGAPGYGENSPPPEEQADTDAPASPDQYRTDEGRVNARYTGGDMYDFINAQSTL